MVGWFVRANVFRFVFMTYHSTKCCLANKVWHQQSWVCILIHSLLGSNKLYFLVGLKNGCNYALIRFPGRSSLCYCIVILVTPKFSSKSNLYTPFRITSGDKLPCTTAGFRIHVENKAFIWHVNTKVTLTYVDAILWFKLHAFLTVNVHNVHILQRWGKCYFKLCVHTTFL